MDATASDRRTAGRQARPDHAHAAAAPRRAGALSGEVLVSEAKFTKGPWRADKPDMFGDVNILLGDQSEDMRAIACAVSNLRDEGEVVANALLIAAAPDLYGVVIELLGPLERASAAMVAEGLVADQNVEAAFDRAHAALRKARGEA